MYAQKKIALVIPAYNEERLIQPTLKEAPSLIDSIYVVDDCSTDNMPAVVRDLAKQDSRINLIQHTVNSGPGRAIINGYKKAFADGADIVVVVGGDYQMPYEQVSNLLDPIVLDQADYTKGNRFMVSEGLWEVVPASMPKLRLAGNMIITILTKFASGYYKVADVVDGFTAISKNAYQRINWNEAWGGYGYPMDFLIRLNAKGLRVRDVPRRPIYIAGERQSQIKGVSYALKVSPMLLKGFFWRLWNKYVLWDFHPVFLFFMAGLLMLPLGLLFGVYLIWSQWAGYGVSGPRAVLCALLIISGLQFLLYALLIDMEEGKS